MLIRLFSLLAALGLSQVMVTPSSNVLSNPVINGQGLFADGTCALPSIAFQTQPSTGAFKHSNGFFDVCTAGVGAASYNNTQFSVNSAAQLGWSSGDPVINGMDLTLFRDAANTLAQRNGTNAQVFRVYNTFTTAANYERLGINWASNSWSVGPEAATGTVRGGFYNYGPSSIIASAGTIAPTNSIHHISGVAAIATITVPANCTPTCNIYLIPDGIFTTTNAGNISIASTAVVSKTLIMTWDGTKWNPSY